MSRANVDDMQFVAAIGARAALITCLALVIVAQIRRIWDSVEYELGGLPNFQAKR